MAEYHYYAGLCYFELNLFDESLQNFVIAVDLDKSKGIYHYHKALIFSRLDKIEKAIEAYQDALNTFDSDEKESIYQALFNKGICHRRFGQIDLSIDQLKKAITKANEM